MGLFIDPVIAVSDVKLVVSTAFGGSTFNGFADFVRGENIKAVFDWVAVGFALFGAEFIRI